MSRGAKTLSNTLSYFFFTFPESQPVRPSPSMSSHVSTVAKRDETHVLTTLVEAEVNEISMQI
jgi:hypothetical protein